MNNVVFIKDIRLIIAGSRDIMVTSSFISALMDYYNIRRRVSAVLNGGAYGIDYCGGKWAADNSIPMELYNADWRLYGKQAGPVRNKQMAERADALLLIWDGKSRGSMSMKAQMLALNKPIYECILP